MRTEAGITFDEIMSMGISTGIKIIKEIQEDRILKKIDLYRVHGINPEDARSMGTDFYANFMQKKRSENEKKFLESIDLEKSSEKIKKQQLDSIERIKKMKESRNGRKIRT